MLDTSKEQPVAEQVVRAEFFAPDELTAYIQPRWYAAYTRANHERRVADQLAERGVESILSLYSSVRRWKDRRVLLEMPLSPGTSSSISRSATGLAIITIISAASWLVNS
jgi:hypothetical protein